jgi:hypothetical protein
MKISRWSSATIRASLLGYNPPLPNKALSLSMGADLSFSIRKIWRERGRNVPLWRIRGRDMQTLAEIQQLLGIEIK